MNTKKFGLLCEYVAIAIYSLSFYRIIDHRRCKYVGEVDVIASKGKKLIFIEVKGRKTIIGDQLVSINQQNRIRKSAELFLAYNPKYKDFDVRFDLVIIQPFKLPVIFKNAW